MNKICNIYFFVFFSVMLYLSSCATYDTTGSDIDHSYPVTGEIVESGILTPIKESIWKKEEPVNVNSGIYVQGKLETGKYIPENSGKIFLTFKTPYHQMYIWKGNIIYPEGAVGAEIIFDVTGYERNSRKSLTVKNANSDFVAIAFNNPFEDYRTVFEMPCRICTLTCGNNAYRFYGVLENEYRITDTFGFSKEQKEYLPSTRTVYFDDIFFKENQKFQIVNAVNTVVAEIQGNAYTLYDALPESERENMKQGIGIFYAQFLIIRQLCRSGPVGIVDRPLLIDQGYGSQSESRVLTVSLGMLYGRW